MPPVIRSRVHQIIKYFGNEFETATALHLARNMKPFTMRLLRRVVEHASPAPPPSRAAVARAQELMYIAVTGEIVPVRPLSHLVHACALMRSSLHAGDEAAAAGASGRLPEVVPFIPQGVLQTEVARLRGHFGPPVKWLHFVLHELETPSAAMKPWEGRPRTFSVLPQCGLRTPFITIDSEVLREIAGVVVDRGGCPFRDPGKVRVRAPPPAPCAPRARPRGRSLTIDAACAHACRERPRSPW